MPLLPPDSISSETNTVKSPIARKRSSIVVKDSSVRSSPTLPTIYVITEGPSYLIWVLETFINKQEAWIIPVFDDVELVGQVLEHLDTTIYRGREILLETLERNSQHKETMRFAFNPQVVVHAGIWFFREGKHWGLKFTELEALVEKASK